MTETPPPAASAPAPAPKPPSSPAPAPVPRETLRVVIRPLPKVVFFWPTWVASALCALLPGELGTTSGLIWMGIFFFNLLVISFDFNEERSLIALLAAIAGGALLLYFGVLGSVGEWLTGLEPAMNDTFYWMMFAGFSVLYFFVWLNSRLDYWTIRPNEVVHRYGVFPKMKRYSTEDLRWDKEVPDILERLLLGSGRIILQTPHEKHPIVIEHVVRIGRVDDRIADILGVKEVVHTESS